MRAILQEKKYESFIDQQNTRASRIRHSMQRFVARLAVSANHRSTRNKLATVSTRSIAEPTFFDHFAVTPVDLILLCSEGPIEPSRQPPVLQSPTGSEACHTLGTAEEPALLHERHQSAQTRTQADLHQKHHSSCVLDPK